MNFLPAWKFQLESIKWPMIIFYSIIAAMLTLLGISNSIVTSQGRISTFGGTEVASMILLFVIGLNAFKAPFHMLMANSTSRKTMYLSTVTMLVAAAFVMALIDSIYGSILRSFVNYEPMLVQLYHPDLTTVSGAKMFFEGFGLMICSYFAAAMAGFLITTLYYRMNKPVKLLVSIGVPVLVLFVWPAVDFSLFGGKVTYAVGMFIGWATGLTSGNPYMGMLTNLLLFAAFGVLSFLAVRRAPVTIQRQ